ncbi:MAG: DUF1905 domain-containing protein [Nocardioides sp.]|uniref:DUF1905 domain-containing protein n=1 Tax=Nocardioides sp. TaxID=35761 RepID=UPI0039E5B85B
MGWTFTGPIVEWRGPAPYLFLRIPEDESDDLREASRELAYWGQVPVVATIGSCEFTTALFPKDGVYLLPVKAAVQRAEAVAEGMSVEATVRLRGG